MKYLNNTPVITGIGIMLPFSGKKDNLVENVKPFIYEDFSPEVILGKKGLKFKDPATLMSLCVVEQALKDSGFEKEKIKQDSNNDIGIIVSSNFGNIDTISKSISIISETHANFLSAMDLPKASSNIVASSIAIRYKFRGPNYTICNGNSSGIDAIQLAANTIKVGRANKMIVVGVEPKNEIIEQLTDTQRIDYEKGESNYKVGEGAACIILESYLSAKERNAKIYGRVHSYLNISNPCDSNLNNKISDYLSMIKKNDHILMYGQYRAFSYSDKIMETLTSGLEKVSKNYSLLDICESIGDLNGAQGVIQCALGALELILSKKHPLVIVTSGGGWGGGFSIIQIEEEE